MRCKDWAAFQRMNSIPTAAVRERVQIRSGISLGLREHPAANFQSNQSFEEICYRLFSDPDSVGGEAAWRRVRVWRPPLPVSRASDMGKATRHNSVA
jgi:hypothetical protein